MNKDQVCASMCAAIWLAGSVRVIEQGARIGFHSAYLPQNGGPIISGGANAVIGAFYKELGLSDEAIYYLTNTPPQQMTWLDVKLANDLGIAALTKKEFQAKLDILHMQQASRGDRIYEQVAPKSRKLPTYPPIACITPEWIPEPCESRQDQDPIIWRGTQP